MRLAQLQCFNELNGANTAIMRKSMKYQGWGIRVHMHLSAHVPTLSGETKDVGLSNSLTQFVS